MSHLPDSRASLSGRVVLITGASSGLGAHFAGFLDSCGARVAVAARRIDSLVNQTRVTQDRALALRMDVTDPDSVAEGVAAVVERFGRLDGLVNNAGTAWEGRAIEMGDADWDRVIATNLTGAFTVAREAARAMAAGQGGAIVNIASILGVRNGSGTAAYAVSKAGVVHLTRSLACEWARLGIRVNALAPGYFPTEMTQEVLEGPGAETLKKGIPMRRFGRLEDLEGPLQLLLSDAGAYITGAVLPVDGGHLCRPL